MFVDVYMFVDAGVCGSLWRPGQRQVSFLSLCTETGGQPEGVGALHSP